MQTESNDNSINTDRLVSYYARRADEYERIYGKPERQSDLAALRKLLPRQFAGRDVLEIACGTGYWTQEIAVSANSVCAVDINEEVLQIARSKSYNNAKVSFLRSDVYSLDNVADRFNAGLAAFWWSHIPKSRIGEFLDCFHSRLQTGAWVVLLDNAFVAGSSTPIARQDDAGNTFQSRLLDDGSRHEVLKNFPSEAELKEQLNPYAEEINYQKFDYYWLLSYRITSPS